MGKGYNPFDLNHDGKADWQDAYIYNELIDSDEDPSAHRDIRWTSQNTDTACSILGTVVAMILIFWVAGMLLG